MVEIEPQCPEIVILSEKAWDTAYKDEVRS